MEKLKSVTPSVLSILIRWSKLYFLARGDVKLISSPCSDSPLLLAEASQSKPHRQSARARAEIDQFTSLQLVWSQFKLDLKERETNEIKHKLVQIVAADLLPNESHATANISLLAHLQLSTGTLCFC